MSKPGGVGSALNIFIEYKVDFSSNNSTTRTFKLKPAKRTNRNCSASNKSDKSKGNPKPRSASAKDAKKGNAVPESPLHSSNKCIDHLTQHPESLPTPNLPETLGALEKKKKKSASPSVSAVTSDAKLVGLTPLAKVKPLYEHLPKQNADFKKLMFQAIQDLEIISNETLCTPFMQKMFIDHCTVLIESISKKRAGWKNISQSVKDQWNDLKITENLTLCIKYALKALPTAMERKFFLNTSGDIVKVGLHKRTFNKGIKVLYHSFFICNKQELKLPFLKLHLDKRIPKVELKCHCRINASRKGPPSIQFDGLFVEVYYDFKYGNHQGAMTMINELIRDCHENFNVPRQDYSSILMFPSGEKVISKNHLLLSTTIPLPDIIKDKCKKFVGDGELYESDHEKRSSKSRKRSKSKSTSSGSDKSERSEKSKKSPKSPKSPKSKSGKKKK